MIDKYGVDAINQMKMSNSTASQIAKNCISKTLKDSIFEEISQVPFALSFDGSSDLYSLAYLCCHVRYIKDNVIKDKFISIIEPKSYTGAELFRIVQKEIFSEERISTLKNVIGVSVDGAPNMYSRKDAELVNRMQKEYPHIISIMDISHCINLVCQYALKKFPSDSITMIKLVCSHFSRSSLRKIKFNEIQKRFLKMSSQKDKY